MLCVLLKFVRLFTHNLHIRMAVKKIYVRPGTLLEVHLVTDPDETLDSKGWSWQLHPRKFLLTVRSSDCVEVHGLDIDVVGGRHQGPMPKSN